MGGRRVKQSMGTKEPVTDARAPFGTVFHVLPEPFWVEVVRTALQHRPKRVLARATASADAFGG